MVKETLFGGKPKSKRIARIINITSPTAFRKSIRLLEKGGLSTHEKRALVLARNRAGAQLKRKNLSPRERKQMKAIKNQPLPKISK